jgi:hypothetical protein
MLFMNKIRLGSGTAWSRDRFQLALDLVDRGNINYLIFESMSEVTMSNAQVNKINNPDLPGYDPYLERRIGSVLKDCVDKRIKIISNQGWLDPEGAAEKIIEIARNQGIGTLRVGAVVGGDLKEILPKTDLCLAETGERISELGNRYVSAEAYLGAEWIVEALKNDAQVVITPRVADPSLYVGPLAYEYRWSMDDWERLGKGTAVGHLIECACQVTGAYFCDPGYKDVPDLAHVGAPIAEVEESGDAIITKTPETGGLVSTATCKEQLLYEIGDPSAYLTPDVSANFTTVKMKEIADNQVQITNVTGSKRPDKLKVLVGVRDGFIAEEMVLYAGPGAWERARLAKEVIIERFKEECLNPERVRMDFLGVNAVHREASPIPTVIPYEVVLRIAVHTKTKEEATKLRLVVDPMAVSGPAGTGKYSTMGTTVRPVIAIYTTLVPREIVPVKVVFKEL